MKLVNINSKLSIQIIYIVVALTSFIVTVFADIPSEIQNIMGKDGILTSKINGVKLIHEDGAPCRIMGGDGAPLVQLDSTSSFKAWANIQLAKEVVRSDREVIYQFSIDDLPLSEKENLCNEVSNIVYLKKSLIVSKNSVIFTLRYRCLFDETIEVLQGCMIQ